MSVEGISKSSIARIMGIPWNAVARWLERAAACRFNDSMTWGYELKGLVVGMFLCVVAAVDFRACPSRMPVPSVAAW